MPEQVQPKRMNLMQLTFIVAVNMMGSGIIMLPANMAQVGAISLLSWIVTALGSMAIAYGFAQAGLFNQRPGGMSAYAEDAYGKSGYFLVFFLYFLSLAIGNVAIGISAVGYLASFFPWLSSTPVATCIGVIALLWLTTVANFGGPSLTGRIGSITVWGVIIPVGLLSLIGWFWFSPSVFRAAWNPSGMTSRKAWARASRSPCGHFLAWNRPRRTRPQSKIRSGMSPWPACSARSGRPSSTYCPPRLSRASCPMPNSPRRRVHLDWHMPTCSVRSSGRSSWLWQSWLASAHCLAGNSRSPRRESPQRTNGCSRRSSRGSTRFGAPVTGMVVLGVVQSLLALSTISPSSQ